MREYRDAVDCVRTAAQVVRELRERQLDGRDEADVNSSLAAIRIRRATNLCLEMTADLDAGRISGETKGVEELQRALDQTRSHAARPTSPTRSTRGHLITRS